MSRFIIEGGHALHGTIRAGGNKNAALPILAACLLTDQPITLHNIPEIQDVHTAMLILQDLGVSVEPAGPGSWHIHAANIQKSSLDRRLAARIRASIVFSGPLLARFGRTELPIPSGDVIGGRPLDTHVTGCRSFAWRRIPAPTRSERHRHRKHGDGSSPFTGGNVHRQRRLRAPRARLMPLFKSNRCPHRRCRL